MTSVWDLPLYTFAGWFMARGLAIRLTWYFTDMMEEEESGNHERIEGP